MLSQELRLFHSRLVYFEFDTKRVALTCLFACMKTVPNRSPVLSCSFCVCTVIAPLGLFASDSPGFATTSCHGYHLTRTFWYSTSGCRFPVATTSIHPSCWTGFQ